MLIDNSRMLWQVPLPLDLGSVRRRVYIFKDQRSPHLDDENGLLGGCTRTVLLAQLGRATYSGAALGVGVQVVR